MSGLLPTFHSKSHRCADGTVVHDVNYIVTKVCINIAPYRPPYSYDRYDVFIITFDVYDIDNNKINEFDYKCSRINDPANKNWQDVIIGKIIEDLGATACKII